MKSQLLKFNYSNLFSNFKLKIKKHQAGFTLPELLVVMAVFAILAGVVGINLSQSYHNASVSQAVDTLVADIRQQQIKTMSGETEGTGVVTPYGIYFQQNSYTLFHNNTYSSSDPNNFIIKFDTNIQLTNILFPSSTLLFTKGSGEVSGFINGSNTVTVTDTNNTQVKKITINKYGVIIQIN